MRGLVLVAAATALVVVPAGAQQPSAAVARYIKVPAAPVIVLQHVRVIDGTGAAAVADQTLTLRDGKIAAIEPAGKDSPGRGSGAGSDRANRHAGAGGDA